ncbi:MAG: 30S ribosome-binding factor RbfA [Endomicrobia bacterium]|nr:30S ribosome-binding factor RbfA [Endomicrobiia bacterium]MCX7940499.1 30S ribosome-binding factor RbfA [Endomicrobiia bacterium]MDW8055126.1 30S ribosome-binding factor RbfA [Elusimicrobiota bacterium]
MKSHPYQRADRIKKLVHREVAKIISSLKDPRAKYVTVTEVEITDDLRNAKIYYTVMNKDEHSENVESMFESAKGFIRKELCRRVTLKHAIDIDFRYDKFLEKSLRVISILDKIKDEEKNHQ